MGKLFKWWMLVLAVAMLAMSGGIQRSLDVQRRDPQLGLTEGAVLTNAPPMLAFTTVALGSFRGLIVNALWMRAMKLQDEAKFFEMVQLSDWITKLQPTFAAVWVNQSWNMAYNISVRFSAPQDRWRWVRRGIELLRDEGLRYNPKTAEVYRELGWLFQHKVGYFLDDAHLFYKAAFFAEMNALLGNSATNIASLVNPVDEEGRRRVETLRSVYKMDPAIMLEVEQKYAKLEWRLPDAHAVYWGVAGLKNCEDNRMNHDQLIGLRRLIYQSLHAMVIHGRLVQFSKEGLPEMMPNFDLIEVTHKGYLEMMQEEKTERGYAIKVAHKNFLREVVYLLYVNNRKPESEDWFRLMVLTYPDAAEDQLTAEAYSIYRLKEVVRDGSLQRSRAVVLGLLGSEISSQAIDQDQDALNYAALAKSIYDDFQSKFGGTDRVRMQPWEEMRKEALRQMLHPTQGLQPLLQARVMAKRNITSLTNLFPVLTNSVPGTNFLDGVTNRLDSLNIDAVKPAPGSK